MRVRQAVSVQGTPTTRGNMSARVVLVIENINDEMSIKVNQSFLARLGMCYNARDACIEHFV